MCLPGCQELYLVFVNRMRTLILLLFFAFSDLYCLSYLGVSPVDRSKCVEHDKIYECHLFCVSWSIRLKPHELAQTRVLRHSSLFASPRPPRPAPFVAVQSWCLLRTVVRSFKNGDPQEEKEGRMNFKCISELETAQKTRRRSKNERRWNQSEQMLKRENWEEKERAKVLVAPAASSLLIQLWTQNG